MILNIQFLNYYRWQVSLKKRIEELSRVNLKEEIKSFYVTLLSVFV